MLALRSRCRKKRVFKRGLKMPVHGLADLKSRTNLRLAGAKNFDIDLARFGEGIAHGLDRQFRRIAIATEMSEHDAVDLSWE